MESLRSEDADSGSEPDSRFNTSRFNTSGIIFGICGYPVRWTELLFLEVITDGLGLGSRHDCRQCSRVGLPHRLHAAKVFQ